MLPERLPGWSGLQLRGDAGARPPEGAAHLPPADDVPQPVGLHVPGVLRGLLLSSGHELALPGQGVHPRAAVRHPAGADVPVGVVLLNGGVDHREVRRERSLNLGVFSSRNTALTYVHTIFG